MVPLTAGWLSTAHATRFSNVKSGVALWIASHPEQRVLTCQKGADAPLRAGY